MLKRPILWLLGVEPALVDSCTGLGPGRINIDEGQAFSAPVYVAILVDSEARYPDYVLYDGTLAAENLVIAARALGYGTGFFTTFFPEKQMKIFFGIPDRYRLICFTPIGKPAEWPERPRKRI